MSGLNNVFNNVQDNVIKIIKSHLAGKSVDDIATEHNIPKKEIFEIIFKFETNKYY